MDNRLPSGTTQRPPLLQRAVSGSGLPFPPRPSNPYLQSPLGGRSNVRSISQPMAAVDLTLDDAEEEEQNKTVFSLNKATSSEAIVLVDDDDAEPPAKRPKTSGDGFRAGEQGGEGTPDRAHWIVPGSPLPTLPATSDNNSNARILPVKRDRARAAAATRRPHGTEPPAIATRVPAPKNVADFSPWTGHHPEDIMNENAVKSGYFDKGASPNESNPARPSIWPNLTQKNYMGLSTLSYLFTQVMEKRQASGKCTSASTFKPPPRVTVTDTKREAWLRDLANPDIPLRKQSRTIPHGIRGKVLMEQCLAKDIPLPRAVWLAKCVGANELRAFRRKGVSGTAAASGESKWISDWTVAVEHFLDGVISTCGHADWQSHMNYSVRLATHFYTERLLDMNHFLDWIISSLADAALDRLPIWLILTQLFWKDLTRFVKRGRKLALTILDRLHSLSSGSSKPQQVIKQRLQRLVFALGISNRACLVIPGEWNRYRHLLAPEHLPSQYHTHLEHIRSRNERLAGSESRTSPNTKSSILDLYAILDGVTLRTDMATLAGNCLATVPDISQLVTALLQWASTPYRSSTSRVYLTARIVSDLHQQGHDVDQAILAFLDRTPQSSAISVEDVYSVVARLVTLKSFSVGAYLQRLITRASDPADPPNLTCGLLTALPVDQLAVHTRHLRRTLLERLGFRDDQPAELQLVSAGLDDDLASSENNRPASEPLPAMPSLTTKMAVRTVLRDRMESRKRSLTDIRVFCAFRTWIEHVDDLPLLADLLACTTQSDDLVVLASVTDTLSMHAQSFMAIDRLAPLALTLGEKYRTLRSQQPLERTFIVALTGLTRQLPGHEALLKVLENDLPVCDQQSTSAACSPASDNLIGVQSNGLDSENDIDAVFASGNTMDQQLMERIFARVISMAVKADGSCSTRVCSWLRQLMCFEPTTFAQIASHFVEHHFTKSTPTTAAGLTALITSGCVTLDSCVGVAERTATPVTAETAIRSLFFIDTGFKALRTDQQYRYTVLVSRFCEEHTTRVVRLLLSSLERSQEELVMVRAADFILTSASRSKEALDTIADCNSLSEPLYSGMSDVFLRLIRRDASNSNISTPDIKTVLRLAQPLSIEICVTALRFLLRYDNFKRDDVGAILQERLEAAISEGEAIWQKLLESAGSDSQSRLHDWAQDKLLFAPAATTGSSGSDMIDRCLDVMYLTRGALNKADDQAVFNALVDRLRDVEKRLGVAEHREDAIRYLEVLLHVAVLSVRLEPAPDGEGSRQATGMLMTALCGLLTHPSLQSHRDLLDCIFDLSSVLYDGLPETVASNISKSLANGKGVSPRILSIIGDVSSSNPDAWLALASQVRPQGSQAQQALVRHASQQGQPTPRGPSITSGPNAAVQRNWLGLGPTNKGPVDMKVTPYSLRRWELMPDATPSMGDNDASLSLSLFGARKV